MANFGMQRVSKAIEGVDIVNVDKVFRCMEGSKTLHKIASLKA